MNFKVRNISNQKADVNCSSKYTIQHIGDIL